MSEYVTDTHALHWHLIQDLRLSAPVRQVFAEADAGLHRIFVPGIVPIEMIYLVEKGRIPAQLVQQVFRLLDVVDGSYAVAPLDHRIAEALQNIPRSLIPDMPDRIITATAYQLGLPLITRDEKIQNSNLISTIW